MKSVRMFIVGLVSGVMLATAGSALAASETVQATVAKFRFLVNGEERKLRTDPIVVKGTTYLPVREVANMLGYDVIYRADSKTIEFNTAAEPTNKGVQQGMDYTVDEIKQNQSVNVSFSELESVYGISVEFLTNEHGQEMVALRKNDKELTFIVPNENGEIVMIKGGYTIQIIEGELYASQHVVQYLTA